MKKKKIRYKVVVYGSGDEGLKFPDLVIKYSSGLELPLKVKKGEYIPDDPDIIDPLDIKKSIAVGSLGKFLKAGWVVEDDGRKPKKPQRKRQKKKPAKQQQQEPVKEEKQVVEEDKSTEPQQNTEPQSEEPQQAISFTEVKSLADFNKIKGFWQRKQFIRVCKDPALLSEILNSVDSASQIANIIQLRIEKLEKGV